MLPGAGGLDGRVKGKKVCLVRYVVYDRYDVAYLLHALVELVSGGGQLHGGVVDVIHS